jgi:DNA-binding XRE family transcriptional regulator
MVGPPDSGSSHEPIATRAVPNYKKTYPLIITLRISRYPSETLGERIKKWRLEQGLFQKDLAMLIGVDEMTIVNWEKGYTKPVHGNIKKLKTILKD